MTRSTPQHPPRRAASFLKKALPLLALATALALPCLKTSRADDQPIPNEIESAVDRGLTWLSRAQDRDGSWAGTRGGGSRSTALTGLAAMAFMARGHVPGQGPYGDNLNRAVDYLLASQTADGTIAAASMSQPMYDHGIATMALCEAYGMLDDRRQELARNAISKAVKLILRAQSVTKNAADVGGWRYTPTSTDSDLSVTGWQLMALRGAANVGADLPPGAIKAGIDYVIRHAQDNGSFTYTGRSGSPSAALTGTGVLALCLLGSPNAKEVQAGAAYLLKDPLTGGHHFYTLYYASQAAWQVGGQTWLDINSRISSELRDKQAADGSWPGSEDGVGSNYTTSMAILALTVPYRYLPIYQR